MAKKQDRRRRHEARRPRPGRSKTTKTDFGENVLIVDPIDAPAAINRTPPLPTNKRKHLTQRRKAHKIESATSHLRLCVKLTQELIMAKKTHGHETAPLPKRRQPPAKLTPRDKKTLGSIVGLADGVVDAAEKRRDPHVDIPSRTLSNVALQPAQADSSRWATRTNRRQLFDLSQAKAYMQTMLVGQRLQAADRQGKTTSIRGLYYLLKHTIEGTKEEHLRRPGRVRPDHRRRRSAARRLREELHLYAENAATWSAPITLIDSGDEIDCSRMGSGGYSIPSIVEPEVIAVRRSATPSSSCTSKRTRSGSGSTKTSSGRSTTASSPTAAASRRAACGGMLHRLHNELKLPVYCLLDNDPWGYYIYSVIKQGSINLAYESQRMAIPDAKYLGLRSNDFERCELSDSVKIKLNDNDLKRAKQIASYPWFAQEAHWQKEIEKMLKNGFKLEVESLISQGHQLRDRGVRAGAAGGAGLAGLVVRTIPMRHSLNLALDDPCVWTMRKALQ